MNPLMSGDPMDPSQPLLEKEKLIIDAAVILCVRNVEDWRASKWDATPDALACRLNVKYHVFLLRTWREARDWPDWAPESGPDWLADMKKNQVRESNKIDDFDNVGIMFRVGGNKVRTRGAALQTRKHFLRHLARVDVLIL